MKAIEVDILADHIHLRGNLNLPLIPKALVIFSHGSGSSRFSPRNRYVAEKLNSHHIATLLTDLLTEQEDRIFENRFNIGLLTQRLLAVTDYVTKRDELSGLPLGYFGASTGAASALKSAARAGKQISAVVSRGGRPDLAMDELSNVVSPTLLIVGELDTDVIVLNNSAYEKLNCEKELRIINGASHLFEEPGTLEAAATHAIDWFEQYLVRNSIPENK
jgi:pimeloyl-ACP methyl ester carboxylesterase